jgi:hypothetical protein
VIKKKRETSFKTRIPCSSRHWRTQITVFLRVVKCAAKNQHDRILHARGTFLTKTMRSL